MMLDGEGFPWRRAGVGAGLVWVAFGLATIIEPVMPWNVSWLPIVAPLLVMFLAGVHEPGPWWIAGSLVALLPPAVLLAGTVVLLAVIGAGDGVVSGIMVLVRWLIPGACAVAISALLGVWAGTLLAMRGGRGR